MKDQDFERVVRGLYESNRQDEIDSKLLNIGFVVSIVLAVLFVLAGISTMVKYFF